MECSQIEELCFDYVEGRLAEGPALEVTGHLSHCARCREEIELYRQTVDVLDHVRQPVMPDSFWEAQAARIMQAARTAGSWEAPPLSLPALLLLPFIYVLLGMEGLGSAASDVVGSTLATFSVGETLTLIPVYGLLIALAFSVFAEPETGPTPDRTPH